MTSTLQNLADGKIQIELTKIPSLNQFYASKHWTLRKKLKDGLVKEILPQLEQYDKVTFKEIEVAFICNYRLDIDNCIMGVKFALDSFKDWGGIVDDSNKYVKQVKLIHDPSRPKGTGTIIFTELKK